MIHSHPPFHPPIASQNPNPPWLLIIRIPRLALSRFNGAARGGGGLRVPAFLGPSEGVPSWGVPGPSAAGIGESLAIVVLWCFKLLGRGARVVGVIFHTSPESRIAIGILVEADAGCDGLGCS